MVRMFGFCGLPLFGGMDDADWVLMDSALHLCGLSEELESLLKIV